MQVKTTTCRSDMNELEKNYRIVSAHLKKAHQCNELAARLQQQGLIHDAQRQSQLTKVLLTNAMHLLSQHCQGVVV